MKNTNAYDIVFWSHGYVETERYLPLAVKLKEEGVRVLLFHQNYNYRDTLGYVQSKIIEEMGVEVKDYSYFLGEDPLLKVVNSFVSLFRDVIKIRMFYNKFRGVLSKLIERRMSEDFIKNILEELRPQIGFFDNINLMEYRRYPYGSYYIKKISRKMGIRCFCIHQAGTGHVISDIEKGTMDFDRFYVPNEYEKGRILVERTNANAEVLSFGDPRFDLRWKNTLKGIFLEEIEAKMNRICVSSRTKILYLCPNLEHVNRKDLKYQSLENVVRAVKGLGEAELLIKPHPRYVGEKEVHQVMRRSDFSNFYILENDPLICYSPYVDFIISSATSALHDVLPDDFKKIIIYDDFSDEVNIRNIFKDHFTYIRSPKELQDFLEGSVSGHCKGQLAESEYNNAMNFYNKWSAAENGPDSVVNNIVTDIVSELGGKGCYEYKA